jgi:hypothetical protein
MYQPETQQRMTVHDAARTLGISEDAVRMRVKRGKLQSDKEDGRLYVLLDSEPTSDPTGGGLTSELLGELRSRASYLEGIISTRDEEIRRRDVIISQLTQRIPEIEPSAEPSEGNQSAPKAQEGAPHQNANEGAQEGVLRPWWRRVFGR